MLSLRGDKRTWKWEKERVRAKKADKIASMECHCHRVKCMRTVYVNKILRKYGKLWFRSHKGWFFYCLHSVCVYRIDSFIFVFGLRRKKEICKNVEQTVNFEFNKYLLNIYSFVLFSNRLVLLFPFYSVVSCICVFIFCRKQIGENMRRPCEHRRKCKCWLWNWHFWIYFFHYFVFVFLFASFVRLKPYVYILLCVSPTLFLLTFVLDNIFFTKWIESSICFPETPARALHFKLYCISRHWHSHICI